MRFVCVVSSLSASNQSRSGSDRRSASRLPEGRQRRRIGRGWALLLAASVVALSGVSGCLLGSDDASSGTRLQWQSLGSGFDREVFALAVVDTVLYAGGSMTQGLQEMYVARWNGGEWEGVSGDINGSVRAMVNYDGDLIVAGSFSRIGGIAARRIARWDGSTWTAMATDVDGSIDHLIVHDGRLIAAGHFQSISGVSANQIAAWNGSTWTPLGDGLGGRITAVASYESSLIATGWITLLDSDEIRPLVSWDGVRWSPWPSLPPPNPIGLSVFSGVTSHQGQLYLAEERASDDRTSELGVVHRWDRTHWTALPGSVTHGTFSLEIDVFCSHNGILYLGGAVSALDGQPAYGIVQWNTRWSPLAEGLDGNVFATTSWKGNLVVAGHFDHHGAPPLKNVALWGLPPD
ncbi:MAG: hypothetical protein R3E12_13495 [Candidatus Eisenbacteria bacterium]